jgi:hypothetical protein
MTEPLVDGNQAAPNRLIRDVNEAQARDAEDERRLPLRGDWPGVRRRTRKKLPYWAQGYIC